MRKLSILFASLVVALTSLSYDNLDLGAPCPVDVIIDREGFCNGYSTTNRQPDWCSYRLTKEEVTTKVIERQPFMADVYLDHPVTRGDYAGSGYDRGHIAPAGDMAWSTNAMINSFFMSNMSPQAPQFNRGIWKELESWVRDTAELEESLFVVSGPIYYTNVVHKKIGRNQDITVPDAYFKVLYDETEPVKMIGFILPNEGSTNSLSSFAVTVDEVQNRTGFIFFNKLQYDIRTNLSSRVSLSDWRL